MIDILEKSGEYCFFVGGSYFGPFSSEAEAQSELNNYEDYMVREYYDAGT